MGWYAHILLAHVLFNVCCHGNTEMRWIAVGRLLIGITEAIGTSHLLVCLL